MKILLETYSPFLRRNILTHCFTHSEFESYAFCFYQNRWKEKKKWWIHIIESVTYILVPISVSQKYSYMTSNESIHTITPFKFWFNHIYKNIYLTRILILQIRIRSRTNRYRHYNMNPPFISPNEDRIQNNQVNEHCTTVYISIKNVRFTILKKSYYLKIPFHFFLCFL